MADTDQDQDEGRPRSLVSPLLSGRSLEPLHRETLWTRIRVHRVAALGAVVLIMVLVVVIGLKVLAERTADRVTAERAAGIQRSLDGATPRDFLAFNAGVKRPGSLAYRIRNEEGFVNVRAVAESSTIRFQPSGWWSGFTERCIVAVVTESTVSVTVPKVACVRVTDQGR